VSHSLPQPSLPQPKKKSWWTEHLTTIIVGLVIALLAVPLVALGNHLYRSLVGPQRLLLTAAANVLPAECEGYLLKGNARPPVPRTEESEEDWAKRVKAVNSGGVVLFIDVQGQTDQAVVLDAMTVVVDHRENATFDRQYQTVPPGCGGGVDVRYFDVDLARQKPTAESRGDAEQPAVDFPYKVANSEPEEFHVNANLDADQLVQFHVEIPWHSGKDKGTLRLPDRGSWGVGGHLGMPIWWPQDGQWTHR